jgi:hypothetical protein
LLAERYQDAGQVGRRGPGKRARQRGRRAQETRYGIDALAATVILQEYLDHLTSKVNDNKE